MAEQPIALLPFYKGWDTYQELLLKAIEPLSLEQLSLRTAPQLRSIGELATHIIGVRAGCIIPWKRAMNIWSLWRVNLPVPRPHWSMDWKPPAHGMRNEIA